MALEQDIFLAVATKHEPEKLTLYNMDRKYEDFECALRDIK